MKHNLLKSVIISVILLMGVSNAWAEKGFFGDGQWNIAYWDGSYDGWGNSYNNASNFDLGIKTTLYLKNGWVKTWSNDNWTQSEVIWYWGWTSGSTTNNWKAYKNSQKGDLTWDFDITDYDLIGNAPNNPGHNTLYMYWRLDNYVSSSTSTVTFTIPGFTSTNTSKTFSNTTVGSNSSQTISFGTHYGTALTTSNCTITGTNKSDFSVTNISESGVTVKFAPTTAGNKSATLTITDAHSKECTITLSGTATLPTYTVTFNANGHGTAPAAQTVSQGNKATQPTAPTATGYTFGGWYKEAGCTNAFDFNTAINANITLYAKWTANKYTVTLNPQSGTGGTTSVTATYGAAMPEITKPTRTGYTFNGYYDAASGGTQYYKADGSSARTWNKTAATTLYARWAENQHSVTVSYKFGAQTIKDNTTHNVGEVTATNISAPSISGYTFSSWTLGSGLQSGNSNQSTISITTKSSGDYTLTANYTEDITSDFVIRGGSIFGNTWVNNNNTMTKKTGSSGQNIVYYSFKVNTLNVDDTNSDFHFKVYNTHTGKWYGLAADDQYWYNRGSSTQPLAEGDAGENIELRSDMVGTYEIKVDYTDANSPKITINYPEEIYLKGDFNEWGNTHSLMNGSVTVNLKAGVYEFKIHRYDKNKDAYWCSNGGTMTRANCSNWDMSDNENTNCKITADIDGDYTFTYDRTNGKLTVHYPLTITLVKSEFGPYGIKYNGKSYYSRDDKNTTVIVPYGAVINFIEGQPYSDIYTGGIMQSAPEVDKKRQVELNQPFTVLNDVTFDDNYVTNVSQTIYLGVPNSSTWNNNGTANLIWRYDSQGSFMMYDDLDMGKEVFEANGVKYYEFILQPGCNKFQFQRKDESTHQDLHNASTTYAQTLFYIYGVLNTDVNCYMLDGGMSGGQHTGYWCELPPQSGDYRLLYIEQKVEKKDWKTVITRTKAHPSNIIRKGTDSQIVSLYINAEGNHPEVILQKYDGTNWTNQERHMVLGPLTADAGMAMLPGRRNAANENILIYDDGIEVIKDDVNNHKYKGSGVWNFTVVQDGSSAHLDLTAYGLKRYKGEYYIRCDAAFGQWNGYKCSDNHMTRSNVSMETGNYSHYYCKWIENTSTNVKFTVANDYGHSISDTLTADMTDMWGTAIADNQKIVTGETLPASANVRFTWNEKTNLLHRAYIAGSTAQDFLTATYAGNAPKKFDDMGEWVYEINLAEVKVGDALTAITANYAGESQQLLEETYQENGLIMLASAGNDDAIESSYTVRIVYDFKINQTICYLIPTETDDVATSIDVLIERINQDEAGKATQVTTAITSPDDNPEGFTVYGLITLTKDHITNPAKSEQEALTYWISFPFNVKIGDITGFGEVGKHWMIKYYDGAERAEKGWFLDTKTFWKFFLDTDDVMLANTGYVLTLNKSLLNESNPVYDNTETLRLYFPSQEKIKEVNGDLTETSVTLEPLKCNITTPADRTIKDSHWNLIGVPSYAHKTNNNRDIKFFYDYNFHEDKYSAEMNAGPNTFYAMHAYMVQFAGTINWSTFATAPAQLAAKKNADAEEQYTLRLELQQNGTKADQTFVELHDDATTMFDMNVDLTKMFNASSANIYTLIGSDNQVAANVMPIANTTIPVGVQIAKAGEYTFAMPDGTDGITVELIDYETNTRTNLLFNDYTVNLPAGTNESRFALYMQPSKVATDMENISDETTGLKKYIIDGQLFLQKDGMLYDAQGQLIR